MLDRNRWTDEEWMILEAYSFRCVVCGFRYADVLHHEPPRSLNPNHKEEPWTQFPLCGLDHDAIQDMPRHEAMELILSRVDLFAPGAVERIKEKFNVAH